MLVEPAYRSSPPFTRTLGPEVADLAALAGFEPDPEQRLGLDLLFGLDVHRRSAAFEFAVVCSRQNLKTGLFKQAALGWLFVTDQDLVVWSAHEFRTAQEAFRDMEILITGCAPLARRVKKISYGNGEEAIELLTGQRLIFKARTKTGGRGLSGDKVVLDEAFALQPAHMGALMPTLSVRPDPQLVYGSSAGLAESAVLRGVRDRGRAGSSARLAYLEWCSQAVCAEPASEHMLSTPGCALDVPENWRPGNPLLGRTRRNGTGLMVEYVRAERQALPPRGFARERMGWWDAPAEQAERPIRPDVWARAATADAAPMVRVAFGVTVAADRGRTTIGVAGLRADGRVQVEVVADGRGVDWAPSWLAERVVRWGPVAVVLDGTALPLQPSLADLGVVAQPTTTTERSQASVAFFDALVAGGLCHPDEPLLNTAALTATRRPLTSGWVWEGPSVGALQAVTLARWGLVTAEVPRTPQPPLLVRSGRERLSETADLATAHF